MRAYTLPTSHVGGRRQVLRRLHVGLPVHGLSAWGEGGNVGPPRVHPHFGQVREGGRERARGGCWRQKRVMAGGNEPLG